MSELKNTYFPYLINSLHFLIHLNLFRLSYIFKNQRFGKKIKAMTAKLLDQTLRKFLSVTQNLIKYIRNS